ncbi:MAG: hypothetical protein JO159_03995 [Acidobacteria bacterium]|nr:hypothetical protein [Acidobacteriota bacterium]
MKCLRLLCLATSFLIPLALPAQNPNAASPDQKHEIDVDGHLNKLTEALSLTPEQQQKVRPILKNFLQKREELLANGQISDSERTARIQTLHARADKQVRRLLSDDQRTKLTQLEQDSHTH